MLPSPSIQKLGIANIDPSLQNVPRSRYVRPKGFDQELAYLCAKRPKSVIALARAQAVKSPDRVREEVIVCILRQWSLSGLSDEAWELAEVLTRRIRGRVVRTLQVWRLDIPAALRDELYEEISTDFYESLFDTSKSGIFWEIRFWVAFDRNLLDIVRRKRKEDDRVPGFEQSNQNSDDDQSADSNQQNSELNSITTSMMDPETSALVSEALLGLPNAVRHAFVLKYYAGLQEESGIENAGVTISSALNVSGRTVRNYIIKAERHLAKWREGSAKHEDYRS